MDYLSSIFGTTFRNGRLTLAVATAWIVLGAFFGGFAYSQDILGIRLYPAHPYNNVEALAFTSDSKNLIAYNALGKISIVDVLSSREVKLFYGPEFVSKIAMTPKGDVLVGMRNGFEDILLWNTRDWKPLPVLHTPAEQGKLGQKYRMRVYSIALSPDGKTLAAECGSSSTVLWDMATRKIRLKIKGKASGLSFSPDSTLLASESTFGKQIIIREVETGNTVHEFLAHEEGITAISFLPGGTKLISSGKDSPLPCDSDPSIKIWDIYSGKLLQTLKGHTNSIRAIAPLSNDKLITGGMDGTVRLWDLKTSQELRKVDAGDMVTTLVLSPDGKYLACGMISSQGLYHLWKLSEAFPEAVSPSKQ